MSRRPSRRQWFLGIIGGIFGASVARAADSWFPGGTKVLEGGILRFTCHTKSRWTDVTTVDPFFKDIAVIEQGTDPGTFRLRLINPESGKTERTYEGLESLNFDAVKLNSPQRISRTVYEYDSNGKLETIVGGQGRQENS